MFKKLWLSLVILSLLSACEQPPANTNSEETAEADVKQETEAQTANSSMNEAQKRAYALGANSAGFLARSFPEFDSWGMEVDRELVKKGFIDMLEGNPSMSTEELQAILMAFQQEIQTKVAEIEEQQLKASVEANAAFMEAHAKQEGVQITESGLQYRTLTEGTGKQPVSGDVVRVNYEGSLIDGVVFDSSYERGQPLDFEVDRVIPGWAEGIKLVKEGGKIEIVMGPELGYGDRATGNIPANSALKFEVELLAVNPEPEPEPEEAPATEN